VTARRVAGCVLALSGALVAWEARSFEVGFLTDPVGPKALPGLVAVLFLFAGAAEALARPSGDPAESVAWPERAVARSIGGVVASFVAYALLLPVLGFFLSTTAVVAAISALYGGPRGRGTLVAAVLAGALWLLFVQLLGLPLPVGSLWIL